MAAFPPNSMREDSGVLFTTDAHGGLLDGSITVTVRRWRRRQAKVGGRFRVAGNEFVVDAVEQMTVAALTDDLARRCGAADVGELRSRLAEARPEEPLDDETLLWRVEFHVIGRDERQTKAARSTLDDEAITAIAARLDRMDRAATHGPWTRRVLALIGEQPGSVSTDLAATLGRDRAAFKRDVRKLKELGLTESMEVGYRLSPAGVAFMASER